MAGIESVTRHVPTLYQPHGGPTAPKELLEDFSPEWGFREKSRLRPVRRLFRMNRRNFIGNLLATGAGFMILPGAGRIWRAVAVVPDVIAYVDKDGNYHYVTRGYFHQSWQFMKDFWELQPINLEDLSWVNYVRDVKSDPKNRILAHIPIPKDPTTLCWTAPKPGPHIPSGTEYDCEIVDSRPEEAKRIHP